MEGYDCAPPFSQKFIIMPTLSDIKSNPKAYRLPEKIETILIPTDFSDASRNAFLYALDIGARLGSEIVVAHIHNENEVEQTKVQFDRAFEAYKQAAELRAGSESLNISSVLERGKTCRKYLAP